MNIKGGVLACVCVCVYGVFFYDSFCIDKKNYWTYHWIILLPKKEKKKSVTAT